MLDSTNINYICCDNTNRNLKSNLNLIGVRNMRFHLKNSYLGGLFTELCKA